MSRSLKGGVAAGVAVITLAGLLSVAYATTIVGSPSVVNIIGSGAQITWMTDIASDSQVNYGLSTSNLSGYSANRCDAGGNVLSHCVNLTGLSSNTLYSYKVSSYASGMGFGEAYGTFTSASGSDGGGGGSSSSIPAAPSQLQVASTPTASQIFLTWHDNSTNEDKFNIERKRTADSNYSGQFLAQLSANTTTYTDTTVAAGTSYDYRVQACLSGYGCSEYVYLNGVSSASLADTSAPTIPTGLVVISLASNQLTLEWAPSTDNVGVAGYKIYRNGTSIGVASTVNYTDSTVAPGIGYYYNVAAYDAANNFSAQSASVYVNVPTGSTTDTTLPATPTGLSAIAVSSSQVDLSWTASTDNIGVTGYKIFRGDTFLTTVTATSYSNSGLSPSTTYSYTVKAVDAAGNVSPSSAAASATTSAGGGSGETRTDTQAPSTPTGLVATKDEYNEVDLKWYASTDNVGVTGYAIYRSANAVWTLLGHSSNTTYADTTVVPSTPYYYAVKAYDAAGNTSATSTPLFLNVPLQAPANVNASFVANGSYGSSTKLTWSDVARETSYKIFERPYGTTAWTLAKMRTSETLLSDAIYKADTLSAEVRAYGSGTYEYKVAACGTVGCADSLIVSVVMGGGTTGTTVTTSSIPLAPSSLRLYSTPTSSQISFMWTDNATNEDKFNVERKLASEGNYSGQFFVQLNANVTSYTDTTVSLNTNYDYRVQACREGYGCSGYAYLFGVGTVSETASTATTTASTTPTLGSVTVSAIFGSPYCEGLTGRTPLTLSVSPYGGAFFKLSVIVPTSTTGVLMPGTYPLLNGVYRWEAIAYSGYALSGKTSEEFTLSRSCANATTSPETTTTLSVTTTISTTDSIPAAPSHVRLNGAPTASKIFLLWTDNATNEDKFNVERKRTADSNYSGQFLAQLSANTTTYTDTTVAAGTSYDYRVQACREGYGCSAYAYLIGVGTPTLTTTNSTTMTAPVSSEDGTTGQTTAVSITSPTASSVDVITTVEQYKNYCDDPAHKVECQTYASTQVAASIVAPIAPPISPDAFTILQSAGESLPAGATNPQELQSACTQTQYATSCADLFVESGIVDRKTADQAAERSLALQAEAAKVLTERIGARIFLDTDGDGIADYDEVNIYHTDPRKADTNSDGVADGAQLLFGTDPLAKVFTPIAAATPSGLPPSKRPTPATTTAPVSPRKIDYEDPKFAGDIQTKLLAVTAVAAVAADLPDKKATATIRVKLEGRALPNSFVTLFVYSEPIVVTVKADASGAWTYTLDKELSDGTHEVYSAITDVGGRVLAKSEPLPFVKEAAAVSFGGAALLPSQNQAPGFFSGGSLYALLAILIGVLGIAFLLIGWMTRRNTSITLPDSTSEQPKP